MTKYSTELPAAQLNKGGVATTAGWITVYCIEPDQNEFTSVSMEYLPVGVGLPALSYIDKPELPADGFALVRSQDGKAWESKPDFRGATAYSTLTRQPQVVLLIGDLPDGMTLLAPQTDYDIWDGEKWVTDNDALHAADVTAAEGKKATLLRDAQSKISGWQTELQLNIISDEDKAKLIEWMGYIKALNAVDASAAPDIEWPGQPA